MDHNSYKEQLSALLDGELNETERAAALAHLAECEECRAYFAELTAMHDALTDLDEAEPPADFAAGVLARLHEEAAPQKAKKRRSPWRSWAALAACAAVAALAILLPGKGMGKTATSSSEYASAAPTASAPTETTSTPADSYGFTGEANDGYGAAAEIRGETVFIPGTSQRAEFYYESSAKGTTDAALSNGMQEYPQCTVNYRPNGSETAAPEPPAENTAPMPPAGETAPEPPAEDTVSMLPAEDPAPEWWEEPTAPMIPGSMAFAGEPSQTLTLVGEGAAEWLAEHAEPLGGGRWLVSVEAVNELPDTLELVGEQEPQGGMLVILFETPENP